MTVPVVDLRVVRVRVFQWRVHMDMGVWLGAVPLGAVRVLMMLIMAVRMFMLERHVSVPMRMAL